MPLSPLRCIVVVVDFTRAHKRVHQLISRSVIWSVLFYFWNYETRKIAPIMSSKVHVQKNCTVDTCCSKDAFHLYNIK